MFSRIVIRSSVLVIAALVASLVAVSPARAAEPLVLSGTIEQVSDDGATRAAPLFRMTGGGYLPIDLTAIGAVDAGAQTLRVRASGPVDASGDAASAFTALRDFVAAGGELTAVGQGSGASSRLVKPLVKPLVNQSPATSSVHTVYAVMVTPANNPATTRSSDLTESRVTALVKHVDSYWKSQSAGRVRFALAGFTDWYKSSIPCTDAWGIWNEASTRASEQLGFEDGANSHVALFFPDGTTCGGAAGLGTVGQTVNSGGLTWVIGTNSKQAFAHELGHNMSLGHADWLNCSSATPNPTRTGTEGCERRGYGDFADVMAYSRPVTTGGSLSSVSAIRSGLWGSSSYSVAPAGTSRFTLNSLGSAKGKRAVVIEDATGLNYFVDFRDFSGVDRQYANSNSCDVGSCAPRTPGIRVLLIAPGTGLKGSSGSESMLIGRTVNGVKRGNYVAGESFSVAGVKVRVTRISGGTAGIVVTRSASSTAAGTISLHRTRNYDNYLRVGDRVTAMLGEGWRADRYSYAWYRDGVLIPGATGASYVVRAADMWKRTGVMVTATTRGGATVRASEGVTSNGLGSWAPGIIDDGGVSVTNTTSTVRATLEGWRTTGVAYSYQWFRGETAIASATAATHRLVPADRDAVLAVRVTATRDGFETRTAMSEGRNLTIAATGTPELSAATPAVGGVIGVSGLAFTSVDGTLAAVTRSYQWRRNGASIAGATKATYKPRASDVGSVLSVAVRATAPGWISATTVSTVSAAVTAK